MLILLAFSKSVRDHEGQKEKGPSRKLSDETKEMKSLSSRHELMTMPGYCLPSSLTVPEDSNFYAILLDVVEEVNWIKRLAQKAHIFLIDRCVEDNRLNLLHPSTHGSTEGNGGFQFFHQLLSIIRNGKVNGSTQLLPIFSTYIDELYPFFLNNIGMIF